MRVVVLHSDVPADARADEVETLLTAQAIEQALRELGHRADRQAFDPSRPIREADACVPPDVVFNLVESVQGDGFLACVAPAILEKLAIAYTGAGAASLALCADKLLTKRVLRAAGLPTPDWSEPPAWNGLQRDGLYIVKSVTEDASIGLDDGAVVRGTAVRQRVNKSNADYGGAWFAERYLAGREFNVALLEVEGHVHVLPIAEMQFEAWPTERPRIVGYAAKWDDASEEAQRTVRRFGIENEEPALGSLMGALALDAWNLLGLRGYARVDFRTDGRDRPHLLEANPNPCLDPGAGFAAAAAQVGMNFSKLIERILRAAVRG